MVRAAVVTNLLEALEVLTHLWGDKRRQRQAQTAPEPHHQRALSTIEGTPAHLRVKLVRQEVTVLCETTGSALRRSHENRGTASALPSVKSLCIRKGVSDCSRSRESGERRCDVLLPVDKPVGDLELAGVLHDGDDALKLVRVELTGTGGASESASSPSCSGGGKEGGGSKRWSAIDTSARSITTARPTAC